MWGRDVLNSSGESLKHFCRQQLAQALGNLHQSLKRPGTFNVRCTSRVKLPEGLKQGEAGVVASQNPLGIPC